MDEKKTTPEKEAALKHLRDQFRGLDSDTQARRLLEALRQFPITTFEASRFLDVYHPAGRIKDLRDEGNKIITLRKPTTTEAGVTHSVGQYVLIEEVKPECAA